MYAPTLPALTWLSTGLPHPGPLAQVTGNCLQQVQWTSPSRRKNAEVEEILMLEKYYSQTSIRDDNKE